jgi:hypothetical protein
MRRWRTSLAPENCPSVTDNLSAISAGVITTSTESFESNSRIVTESETAPCITMDTRHQVGDRWVNPPARQKRDCPSVCASANSICAGLGIAPQILTAGCQTDPHRHGPAWESNLESYHTGPAQSSYQPKNARLWAGRYLCTRHALLTTPTTYARRLLLHRQMTFVMDARYSKIHAEKHGDLHWSYAARVAMAAAQPLLCPFDALTSW